VLGPSQIGFSASLQHCSAGSAFVKQEFWEIFFPKSLSSAKLQRKYRVTNRLMSQSNKTRYVSNLKVTENNMLYLVLWRGH
jgi:hypothetical protein